ncbi:MAG: ribosome-associated translation inhibitor RaiA [Actinomycetota bacterium]
MDLTFTGRGFHLTDEIRETAEHKLASLARLEPRTMRIDLEFIAEHHPRIDGTTRIEAALYVPRKTFRAEAEAEDVPTALDRVVGRLERQIRDHHGRRKRRLGKGNALESARPAPEPVDTAEEGSEERRGSA